MCRGRTSRLGGGGVRAGEGAGGAGGGGADAAAGGEGGEEVRVGKGEVR